MGTRTDVWLLALGSVVVAFGLKLALGPIAADAPLLLFFGAVIVSAWLGGFRAGFLATLLSAAVADLQGAPLHWNTELGVAWALRILLFIGEGAFISAAAQGAFRRSGWPATAAAGGKWAVQAGGDSRADTRPVRLSALVREVIGAHSAEAAAKHVYLEAVIDHGTGAIEGDRERLRQVVATLVVNAIKFTPSEGRVCVRVRRRRQDVELSVVDTGRGIAEQDLERIFLPCDAGAERSLARARRQVHLHGGELDVYSAGPGTGATFTVRLRRLQFAPAAPQAQRRLAV